MPKEKITDAEESVVEAIQEAEELEEKEVVPELEEIKKKTAIMVDRWKPRTQLGRAVKEGAIQSIDEIFASGKPILEAEIVDALLPRLEVDLLLIGQAKGKFGGGQRRIFRQVQKKTAEGNKVHFASCAVVGNRNGYVGIGYGKSKETVPSRDKSIRNAKQALMKIRRGCGSWQCGCATPHSIPFAITGKNGSCEITLIPAPKGKGLIIEEECAKILRLAGVKDIWCKTRGQTVTKYNLILALVEALKKLNLMKYHEQHAASLGICEGAVAAA